LAYIVGICWGEWNCTKLSYLMCPYRGIKCPHLILGVLLPKNVWAEKRSFLQGNFATLLQVSPDWNKIYRDWKTALHTAITPVHAIKFGELWFTNRDKKLSYRRETARQLPTWRGLSPPIHSPSPLWLHLCVWSNPKPATNVRQACRP